MAELKIKVDGSIETDVKNLSEAGKQGIAKNAFPSEKSINNFNAYISEMQELAKQTEMSRSDLDKFNHAFKQVQEILEKVSKNATTVTEKMQKLYESEDEYTKKIDEAKATKSKTTVKLKNKDEEFFNLLSTKGISVKGPNGGHDLKRLSTVAKTGFDKLTYYDSEGNQIKDGRVLNKTFTSKLQELINTYNETIEEQDKANKDIEQYGNKLKETQDAIKERRQFEKKNKIDSDDAYRNTVVNPALHDTSTDIQNMYNNLNESERNQTILNGESTLLDTNVKSISNSASSIGKLTKQLSL